MRVKLLVTLSVLLFSQISLADDLLKRHCQQIGGEMVKTITCPKSKLRLSFGFCLSKDPQGTRLFSDGCTGPMGEYKELFYPLCIQHDHCYHHEPSTNGLSRKDCDMAFLDSAVKACDGTKKPENCQTTAKSLYVGLRAFGWVAFNCADYPADYL